MADLTESDDGHGSSGEAELWTRKVKWNQVDHFTYESWRRLGASVLAGGVLALMFYVLRVYFAITADGSWVGALTGPVLESGGLLAIYGIFATMAFTAVVSQSFLGRGTDAEDVVITLGLHRAIEMLSIVSCSAWILFVVSEVGHAIESYPSWKDVEVAVVMGAGVTAAAYGAVHFSIAIVGFVPKRIPEGNRYRRYFLLTRRLERMFALNEDAVGEDWLRELRDVETLRPLPGMAARASPVASEVTGSNRGAASMKVLGNQIRERRLPAARGWMFWDAFPLVLSSCAILAVNVEHGPGIVGIWLIADIGLLLSVLMLICSQPYIGTTFARLVVLSFALLAFAAHLLILSYAVGAASVGPVVSFGPAILLGFAVLLRGFQAGRRFVVKPTCWLDSADLASRSGRRLIRRRARKLFGSLKVERDKLWEI